MIHYYVSQATDAALVRAVDQRAEIGFCRPYIGIQRRPVLGGRRDRRNEENRLLFRRRPSRDLFKRASFIHAFTPTAVR